MTRIFHRGLALTSLGAGLLMASQASVAAQPALDTAWLRLGTFDARSDLDLRWDAALDLPGSGTQLNSRSDLGLSRDARRLTFDAGMLLGGQHQLKLYGRSVEGRGERALQRDLNIDGQLYPTSALTRSRIGLDQLGLAWTLFPWQGEHHAFGLGLGAVRYQFDVDLQADIETEVDGQPRRTELRSGFGEQQWLPMLRAEYVHAFGERWRLGADASWVRKPSGRVRGHALEAGAELEFLPSERWGLALRYQFDRIDLDYRRSALAADLELRNRGPQLLARWRF